LKVTGVEAGSSAAKAGIEIGDILVAANGAALTGPEQLASALRKSGPTLTITVRDTRTGREVPVEVAVPGAKPAEAPEAPPGGNPGRLGAVTELAFYDAEAAVKVTEVEPGGPAARAGLAVGMIILQANDKPILHPDDLVAAVRTADGAVRLLVVEPRSRQKSNVSVDLRGR
jgi:serine protease Do